ncbi:uncharacterized protein N7529_006722 [Penicillium soppii]|uniref:uncharacterized protein n=1 Tax=Penicillium soppii TaxID=69789 RepID=UPI002549B87B|nr:uncharacterized protein N7529_006722 [Penicillium soppii]KAJ5864806.1 hypothetical protein N7529_006722 [Penicillium soppii]
MANSNGTSFSQPVHCYHSRDTMSSLPANINYYNQVPLYQEKNPDRDMEAVLQSCCSNGVWIYEDPDPCTAVCRSSSSAETKRVMYCLNAAGVMHGSSTEYKSGAVRKGPSMGCSLVSLVVGGLLLSGMFV